MSPPSARIPRASSTSSPSTAGSTRLVARRVNQLEFGREKVLYHYLEILSIRRMISRIELWSDLVDRLLETAASNRDIPAAGH